MYIINNNNDFNDRTTHEYCGISTILYCNSIKNITFAMYVIHKIIKFSIPICIFMSYVRVKIKYYVVIKIGFPR